MVSLDDNVSLLAVGIGALILIIIVGGFAVGFQALQNTQTPNNDTPNNTTTPLPGAEEPNIEFPSGYTATDIDIDTAFRQQNTLLAGSSHLYDEQVVVNETGEVYDTRIRFNKSGYAIGESKQIEPTEQRRYILYTENRESYYKYWTENQTRLRFTNTDTGLGLDVLRLAMDSPPGEDTLHTEYVRTQTTADDQKQYLFEFERVEEPRRYSGTLTVTERGRIAHAEVHISSSNGADKTITFTTEYIQSDPVSTPGWMIDSASGDDDDSDGDANETPESSPMNTTDSTPSQ